LSYKEAMMVGGLQMFQCCTPPPKVARDLQR
jgi:hypothetical protein